MSRITLSDRIAIEAGIYAHKTLSEITERIQKSGRRVAEELRKNGTKVPGIHPLGKNCHSGKSHSGRKKAEATGGYYHPAANIEIDRLTGGRSSRIQLSSFIANIHMTAEISEN